MPDQDDDKFVSFADAHDEWARHRQHSAWGRVRASRIFPPRNTSPTNKVLGCFGRIFLFAAVSGLIFEIFLRIHLNSSEFSNIFAEETRTLLRADEVDCSPLHWKNRAASIDSLRASGSTDSFFRILHAEGIRFQLPFGMIFRDRWELDEISVITCEITLRGNSGDPLSEAQPPASTARRDRSPLQMSTAGFGVHPNFRELGFETLDIDHGSFRWGATPSTSGSLLDTHITMNSNQSGYRFHAHKGVLGQGWIQGLRLEDLDFTLAEGVIDIEEASFSLGESGEGNITGSIGTGIGGAFDLRIEISDVELRDFLPAPFTRHLIGHADLSFRITGSPYAPEGVETRGTLRFKDAVIRELPLFEALTTIYADSRFRRPAITHGTAEFRTSKGGLEVDHFSLEASDFARLTGSFNITGADYLFDGRLAYGVRPESIEKLSEIAGKHFPKTEDGLRWASTLLTGQVSELTSKIAERLASDHRKVLLRKMGTR
ncbi:MAG: hypothetical protein ACC661_11330 [Verrucomicrobiales bacterium]